MQKIVILTGNHLCHNPRVQKEAESLADAGFEVEVLGCWLVPELAARDTELIANKAFRFTPVVRLQQGNSLLAGNGPRVRRRLAAAAQSWLGLESPDSLGYGVRKLLAEARTRNADLYIAHSEPALWVARALQTEGHRVGVDMEDWFSRDLLPQARRSRPLRLLTRLERHLLQTASHRTCPSQCMASALARAYGCAPPLAIYNVFEWRERDSIDGLRKDRGSGGAPTINWFSQSLGPGRGLEDLFAALPRMKSAAQVHLRGKLWEGYRDWLRTSIPAEVATRVVVHELIGNDELLSRIAEHDIGVSLEPIAPENKDLTISNKVFQYMQAGLAIVATSTSGIREIAPRLGVGLRTYLPGDVDALAAHLDSLLLDAPALGAARSASANAARDTYSWEIVAPRLVESVQRALQA